MSKLDFVIFDCDGVLVDSEFLSAQICAEIITEAGYELSLEEMQERYSGLVIIDVLKEIERESGIAFSLSLLDKIYDEFRRRIKTDLRAIDDVRQAIEKIQQPYCICSNSQGESVKDMLETVGLYDLFKDKIFSAPEVGNKEPKPFPNVFQVAAQSFNIEPGRSVVIEDSVHGVHGARAAGMRVIGFTGGSHAYIGLADKLSEAGAETVISRHHDLPAVIAAMNEWQDD